MEKVDITIIGAGVIGLAVASQLSRKNENNIVLERHDEYGQETSSRLPGLINSIGIESPGLTSTLSIANKVSKLIDNMKFFALLRMTELAVVILLQEPQFDKGTGIQ